MKELSCVYDYNFLKKSINNVDPLPLGKKNIQRKTLKDNFVLCKRIFVSIRLKLYQPLVIGFCFKLQ